MTALCLFLALSACRAAAGPELGELPVAATERGISKQGEPSRPTPSRTGPVTGIMTLVASRQLSPVRPPAG